MVTTPVHRRAPIVMFLIGAVGGAVGGWLAHRAFLVPAGAASGDAAWQGGPVDFQSIDYDADTAQMLGNVSHSRTGEMQVTVSTTSSGVNFTGVAANGILTVITMFSRFDNAGHHTAVLSMHDGTQDIDTAQFYGVCDSTLKRLN